MKAALALTSREFTRLRREPTRLVGLFGTTLLFWVVIGAGFARSFAPPGAPEGESLSYAGYLMPGMVMMIVLFGTIVSAIGLIQDRHEGYLQSVLVSPAPAWSIALSKTVAGVALVLVQTVPLLLAAPLLGVEPGVTGVLLGAVAIACAGAGVLNIGLLLAWRIDSVAGFHGVMNLILMPMWLLSGALFPADGAAGWMRVVMWANPMHWCHRALSGALGIGGGASALIWALTIGFGVGATMLATVQISRRTTPGA